MKSCTPPSVRIFPHRFFWLQYNSSSFRNIDSSDLIAIRNCVFCVHHPQESIALLAGSSTKNDWCLLNCLWIYGDSKSVGGGSGAVVWIKTSFRFHVCEKCNPLCRNHLSQVVWLNPHSGCFHRGSPCVFRRTDCEKRLEVITWKQGQSDHKALIKTAIFCSQDMLLIV